MGLDDLACQRPPEAEVLPLPEIGICDTLVISGDNGG